MEAYEEILEAMVVNKIDGCPTMKSYESLIDDLTPIAKRLKNKIMPAGKEYGFMALICEEEEYADYTGDENYRYYDPVAPEDHAAAQFDPSLSDATRKANEDALKRYEGDYNKYQASTNVLRQKIVGAIEEEYIEDLKKPVIGYDHVSPYDLLRQIRQEVVLNTTERNEMKALVFSPYEPTTTVRSFTNTIDASIHRCNRWNITITPDDVVDHFVTEMYNNNVFEMKIMTEWETKKTGRKSWAICKTYLIKHANDLKNFNKSTAKKMGYHSAGNMQEQTPGEEEP